MLRIMRLESVRKSVMRIPLAAAWEPVARDYHAGVEISHDDVVPKGVEERLKIR